MDPPALFCPQCGFENPTQMRFCGNCGAPLESPKSIEERKLVTVLFADVVSSTRLASTIDPEQLRAEMTRFFNIAREEIERYGGTVEKFIGDAVMAVFGLPTIHEDDSERAARAALAMRSRVRSLVDAGTLPEIRIGINTGEVVANPKAADKGEFLVTGEVVNLAARIQQNAGSGQVLIGERTMFALRRLAQIRTISPLAVQGRSTALPAWELLDINPARERELQATPFVGREEELELLTSYLRRLRREGRGHVITILGPAGVGKTRLAREFRARIPDAQILRGRALPYGTGVPFWSLGEAIREECGIFLDDPLEVARHKVEDTATRLEVREIVPPLLSVLGLGGDGRELTREALFSGMRTFFQALAHRSPLVLILEDFHSAEDVTLDFLEHAADWVREIPLLLLVLSRPELLERRTSWMGGKRGATTLVLDPLGSGESRALLLGVLGTKTAPEPLVRAVLERAEGNPLFMEEMVRALMERGVLVEEGDRWILSVPMAEVIIPDTVHAVIAARVDALPLPEKQTLESAAVLGKDFWIGQLHFVAEENHVDETVRALVGKELLIHKRRSSLIGEEEFTFRHILIRDVAYAMIPKAQRWPKHTRCAEWFHRVAGDRQAEYADFIAHHWLQVVGLRKELGLPPDERAREQAIANLLLAGGRAASVYANTTALDHYGRVLDLEAVPSVRLRALLGRGEVWNLLGQYERAREDFAGVRILAQETGQPRWEAVALDHLGLSFRQQDQFAQALEHLEPALSISRQVGDPALSGRILNHIGFTYFSSGKHAEALRAHQEARQLLEAVQDRGALAESYHGFGENLWMQGHIKESVDWFLESIKTCEQVGNRSLAGENWFMIAASRLKLGDYAGAQTEVQRAMTTLDEIGDAWNLAFALSRAAAIAVTLGEFGKALAYTTRGLSLARQIGVVRSAVTNLQITGIVHREIEGYHNAWELDREAAEMSGKAGGWWMPLVLASLALDVAALGRLDEAEAQIRRAQQVLNESQERLDLPQEVAYAEAHVLLALGRPLEARETARNLTEMAEATGTHHWRAPARMLWATATAAMGDLERAVPAYVGAAEEAEGMGRLPLLWRALAGLAEAQHALGKSDRATMSAQRAREIIDRLATTISDERLRATFLQSARVQRITALVGS